MEPETVDLSRYPVCDFDPYLIQFSEGIGIRWYGLAYIMGFVVAYLLLRLYHKRGRIDFNADEQLNLMTAIILGTFVGGRLGYMLLYTPGALVDNPLSLFKVWEGGMASHGGFVGICVGMWWFARRQKTSFWNIADICVTLGPAGVFFGRIANFINGEL
ncbi:MAG: prolipoprotein diacylglyceryl transferase, partial [Verrucomicrobiota bacterium]